MEFDKTRELPRPTDNPKDPVLGAVTLTGFLFVGCLVTAVNPIFLEATMSKVYLLLIALLALAVGLSSKIWWLSGVGVLAGIPLMLAPVPWALQNDPLPLAAWLLLALAGGAAVTTGPDRVNLFLGVGLLALFASLAWQLSHFASPKLVVYNGLGQPVVVQLPEPLTVPPSAFASAELPSAGEYNVQAKSGSVVEKIEVPSGGFLGGSVLYNVKGRGKFALSASPGLPLEEQSTVQKVTRLGPRGADALYPGSDDTSKPHWVKVRTQ